MLRSVRRIAILSAAVCLFGSLVHVPSRDSAEALSTVEFITPFRNAGEQSLTDVHVNKASGDSYVIGWSESPLNANGDITEQSVAGDGYAFLAKIGPNGQRLWTRSIGNTAKDSYPTSIAQDADGSIYITLQHYVRGIQNIDNSDIYVEKWTPAGVRLWQKNIATNGSDRATGIDVTSNYVYFSGSTTGAFQVNSGGYDAFVMSLNKSNGSIVSKKQFGTAGDEHTYGGVRVLSDGSVAVSGGTDGNFVARGARDDQDFLYVRLSGNLLNRLTLRQWGSLEEDFITDMERMTDGRLVMSGGTDGLIAGTVAQGRKDGVVLVTSSEGVPAWTARFGSANDDYIMAVEQSPTSSNILFFGDTGGVTFNSSSGWTDLMGGTLSPNGALLASKQMGTSADDLGNGMSLRSDASPVLVGQTYGSFDATPASRADGFVWSAGVDIGAIAKYLGNLTKVPNLSVVRDLSGIKVAGSLSSAKESQPTTPKACYEVVSVSKILRKDVAVCAGLTVKKGTKTYIRVSKKNTPGVCRVTLKKRLKVTAAGTCKVKIRATQASGRTKAVWINYTVS